MAITARLSLQDLMDGITSLPIHGPEHPVTHWENFQPKRQCSEKDSTLPVFVLLEMSTAMTASPEGCFPDVALQMFAPVLKMR